MQDYSSLIQRCKETSLNIFTDKSLVRNRILFSHDLFKEINIFSFKGNLAGLSPIEYVIDRLSKYNSSKYAFYTIQPGIDVSYDLILYMIRWITIYDAVFLLDKEKSVIDLGIFSGKYFTRDRSKNLWQNAYIKYITRYEIEGLIPDDTKFRHFSSSI